MSTPGRTFVVRVYVDRSSTVEDVRTGTHVRVSEVSELGDQIAQLLGGPDGPGRAEVAEASDVLARGDPGL